MSHLRLIKTITDRDVLIALLDGKTIVQDKYNLSCHLDNNGDLVWKAPQDIINKIVGDFPSPLNGWTIKE